MANIIDINIFTKAAGKPLAKSAQGDNGKLYNDIVSLHEKPYLASVCGESFVNNLYDINALPEYLQVREGLAEWDGFLADAMYLKILQIAAINMSETGATYQNLEGVTPANPRTIGLLSYGIATKVNNIFYVYIKAMQQTKGLFGEFEFKGVETISSFF